MVFWGSYSAILYMYFTKVSCNTLFVGIWILQIVMIYIIMFVFVHYINPITHMPNTYSLRVKYYILYLLYLFVVGVYGVTFYCQKKHDIYRCETDKIYFTTSLGINIFTYIIMLFWLCLCIPFLRFLNTELQIRDIPKNINYVLDSEVRNIECTICLDPLVNGIVMQTPCNHQYHKKCILDWYNIKKTCPLCNRNIDDY